MASKQLYRKPKDGQLTGVSAGLADYFDIDVTIIRILFIVGTLATGGLGLLAYIAMAIITPSIPESDTSTKATQSSDPATAAHSSSSETTQTTSGDRLRNYAGIGLVVFGVWLLLVRFLPNWMNFNWEYIWPTLLIFIGVFILMNQKR